jgi:hypothetical protein
MDKPGRIFIDEGRGRKIKGCIGKFPKSVIKHKHISTE